MFSNILSLIGHTPLINLDSFSENSRVHLYAKLEGNNPGGSIKDRIALFMIADAEERNLINKNTSLIEPTSGNTGIGLAMISALKGYSFTAVMPASASIERRKILQAFGATLILTDGNKGTNYAIEITKQLLRENHHYQMLDQFNNPINVQAHYLTTGIEIIKDLPKITHFVAGMGTGGTLMGIGKRLKEYNPNIKVIGVEPKEHSAIQGLRNMTQYQPAIFKFEQLDKTLHLNDDEIAFSLSRRLIKQGISVGISSGAALWGAIELSKKIEQGNIVTIFPDRADRYTSTKLFD